MTYIGKNIIVGLIFLVIAFLIITTKTSQMFLAMLFSLFVLNFSEKISGNFIDSSKKMLQKFSSFLISAFILFGLGWALYQSFKYMALDLNQLIQVSQPKIIEFLNKLGLKDIESVSQFYNIIIDFVKGNVGFIASGAGLIIKVIIGLLFGLVFHFSVIHVASSDTVKGAVINDLTYYSDKIFNSFKNIMEIQVLVSMMNTIIISVMALGVTYIWTMLDGSPEPKFLPYWYVIIPLTAILSLIPVVGNILINLILIMATIQISPEFVLVGLGLFLVIHKLELILVGKKMKEKVDMPFPLILISMLLGEFLFHSMSGMLLGMVIILTISNILSEMKYIKKEIQA